MPINLTDAEQAFADSPLGGLKLAQARSKFEMSEAHKGVNARPWTDAMESAAIRTLTTQHARDAVTGAARMAQYERQAPILRAQHDAAYAKSKEDLSNAWRNGR